MFDVLTYLVQSFIILFSVSYSAYMLFLFVLMLVGKILGYITGGDTDSYTEKLNDKSINILERILSKFGFDDVELDMLFLGSAILLLAFFWLNGVYLSSQINKGLSFSEFEYPFGIVTYFLSVVLIAFSACYFTVKGLKWVYKTNKKLKELDNV